MTGIRHKNYIISLFSISMFFTGMSGIINEYILAKLSTDILGNSAVQWSLVIGIMLLMMGLGGSIQLLIKDNKLINAFIGIEISLALLCSSAPLVVLWAFGFFGIHFKLILYFYIILTGLLVGAEIPLIIRLSKVYVEEIQGIISLIFSMDYIGSFIGTLIWLLFIIKIRLPIYKMGFVVASFNFTAAIITFIYLSYKNNMKSIGKLIFLLMTVVVMIVSYLLSDDWENVIYQKLFKDPIVYKEDTIYQTIVLTKNATSGNHYLFINGHTQLYEGDEKIYHESLVVPTMSLWGRNRVLILGGGDGCALREVLKFDDVSEITLVDLDPNMVEFASTNLAMRKINEDSFLDDRVEVKDAKFISASDEERDIYMEKRYDYKNKTQESGKIGKIKVFNVDAKNFLEETTGFYDVVIIDFPDPNNIELTKLYSLEFFSSLKKRLSENGIFVMQSTSPTYAREAFWCIERTMNAAGFNTVPYHIDVPSFGDWGFIMGSKKNLTKIILERKFRNLKKFTVETKEINPETFLASLTFRRGLKEGYEEESGLINTLANPILLDMYLMDGWLEY